LVCVLCKEPVLSKVLVCHHYRTPRVAPLEVAPLELVGPEAGCTFVLQPAYVLARLREGQL
jgi:hypothetical protein